MISHQFLLIFSLSIVFTCGAGAAYGINREQAAEVAEQYFPNARILGVTTQGSLYKVKVLFPTGQVRYVLVDQGTGALLD